MTKVNVGINVTKACNLRCPECYILDEIIQVEKDSQSPHITLETLKKVLRNTTIGTASICGGEPFMHPNLLEISTWLRSKSNKLTIATNGHLVDKIWCRKLSNMGVALQWSIRPESVFMAKKMQHMAMMGLEIEAYHLPNDGSSSFLPKFLAQVPSLRKLRLLYNSKNSPDRKRWHRTLLNIEQSLEYSNLTVEVEVGFLPKNHKFSTSDRRGAVDRIMIDTDGRVYNCPLMVLQKEGSETVKPFACTPESCPVITAELDDDPIYNSVCSFLMAPLHQVVGMINAHK